MVNKDVGIAQLLRQNQQQANHIQWLTESFENKIQLLTEENQQLRERIARLEKNSSNSSKPPSSDITNPQPENKKKKKRKIGGQKGYPKHNRPLFKADEIDKTIIHKSPAKEVQRRALVPIEQTESALQQVDLP
jgi:NAD+--asparagine ADP-ribosyltransferase